MNPWISFQPLGWISFAPLVTLLANCSDELIQPAYFKKRARMLVRKGIGMALVDRKNIFGSRIVHFSLAIYRVPVEKLTG